MGDSIGGIGNQIIGEVGKAVVEEVVNGITSVPGEVMESLIGTSLGVDEEKEVNLNSTGAAVATGGGPSDQGVNDQEKQQRLARIRSRIAVIRQEEEQILDEERSRRAQIEMEIQMDMEAKCKEAEEKKSPRGFLNNAMAYLRDSQGTGEGSGKHRHG